MNTQHSPQRCPVYLHPACASSPATVAHIQRETGHLVIVTGRKRATLKPARRPFDDGPWGGDAA